MRRRPVQVVLDTNVLVAALRSRTGASNLLLQQMADIDLCVVHLSIPLQMQYVSLLARHSDELVYNSDEVAEIVQGLCERSMVHNIYFLWRPLLPDPEDEMVAELAITAGADCIVTHNVRDFVGMEAFGIRVLTPVQFLQQFGVVS